MTCIRLLVVSLSLLSLPVARANTPPKQLACGGTEPFWSAAVRDDRVIFNLTGSPNLQEFLIEELRPTANDGLILWARLKSLQGGQPAHLVLTDTRQPGQTTGHCSDGMSDRTYPYSVVFKTPQSLYSGCCE